MSEGQILVLDPTGSDPDAEHQALRECGPATLVDILGMRASSVSDLALLKQLLTSKNVSKDGRAHWPAFTETVATWPPALWVAVENMFTAYGKDHSRLRRMVGQRHRPGHHHPADDPQQLAHIREGRCTWQDVVEETLRHQPAVKHLPLRYARTDIPLPDGQTIKAGEAILASYAAANRHPDWHKDADRFDATRPSMEHLAFGHGVHFCLGAPLARLEVATALRLLFERLPDAQLATERTALKRLRASSATDTSVPMRLRPLSSH
ncbi:cytochrome P450 [Streptomyces sp. NPDC048045]|uniref:cytochrome P450 n=1 Tax=Streptomyces sp. NPDC048045 TaxID=3154710 RepID=UPI00341291A7